MDEDTNQPPETAQIAQALVDPVRFLKDVCIHVQEGEEHDVHHCQAEREQYNSELYCHNEELMKSVFSTFANLGPTASAAVLNRSSPTILARFIMKDPCHEKVVQ